MLFISSLSRTRICVQGQESLSAVSWAQGHDVDPEEQLSGVKLLWTRMQRAQGPTVLCGAAWGASVLHHLCGAVNMLPCYSDVYQGHGPSFIRVQQLSVLQFMNERNIQRLCFLYVSLSPTCFISRFDRAVSWHDDLPLILDLHGLSHANPPAPSDTRSILRSPR